MRRWHCHRLPARESCRDYGSPYYRWSGITVNRRHGEIDAKRLDPCVWLGAKGKALGQAVAPHAGADSIAVTPFAVAHLHPGMVGVAGAVVTMAHPVTAPDIPMAVAVEIPTVMNSIAGTTGRQGRGKGGHAAAGAGREVGTMRRRDWRRRWCRRHRGSRGHRSIGAVVNTLAIFAILGDVTHRVAAADIEADRTRGGAGAAGSLLGVGAVFRNRALVVIARRILLAVAIGVVADNQILAGVVDTADYPISPIAIWTRLLVAAGGAITRHRRGRWAWRRRWRWRRTGQTIVAIFAVFPQRRLANAIIVAVSRHRPRK